MPEFEAVIVMLVSARPRYLYSYALRTRIIYRAPMLRDRLLLNAGSVLLPPLPIFFSPVTLISGMQ